MKSSLQKKLRLVTFESIESPQLSTLSPRAEINSEVAPDVRGQWRRASWLIGSIALHLLLIAGFFLTRSPVLVKPGSFMVMELRDLSGSGEAGGGDTRLTKSTELAAKPAPISLQPKKTRNVTSAEPSFSGLAAPAEGQSNAEGSDIAASPTNAAVSGTDATGSGAGGNGAPGDDGVGLGAGNPYYGIVSRWLDRHKRYPAQARLLELTGDATVYFVLNRSGLVERIELRRHTDSKLLDEEALAMVRRAQRFPKPPADFSGERFAFVIPISFRLN